MFNHTYTIYQWETMLKEDLEHFKCNFFQRKKKSDSNMKSYGKYSNNVLK